MRKSGIIELKASKMTPIEHAVYWAEDFLNNLGGDFSVLSISGYEAILSNTASCSSYCGAGDIAPCNDIEKAINRAIKVFDADLTANFIQCSEDNNPCCRLIVSALVFRRH